MKYISRRELKGIFIEDAMERLECSKGFARGIWETEEEEVIDKLMDHFWDGFNQIVYDTLSQYTRDEDEEDYEDEEE